jgi:hypothetical protein
MNIQKNRKESLIVKDQSRFPRAWRKNVDKGMISPFRDAKSNGYWTACLPLMLFASRIRKN